MKTNLQKLRKAAGWRSANAFADHMGINRSTYMHYEQGQIVLPMDKAWLFADEFDVSLDELLGRTPPTQAKEQANERAEVKKTLYAMIAMLEDKEGADGDTQG